MNTTKLFNLLTAVNFNLDTAIAANTAIGDVSHTAMLKELHSEQTHIIDIESVLTQGLNREYTVGLRSFNDGNNIFDEYVKVAFLEGIPCLSVVNTSYCPQGSSITVDNITDNLNVILAVAKELKSKHNDCAALFLSALTEKAGVLDARQMLDLVNELYGTNI